MPTEPRLSIPVMYRVDDDFLARSAPGWLLRSRRLLSEACAIACAFEGWMTERIDLTLAQAAAALQSRATAFCLKRGCLEG